MNCDDVRSRMARHADEPISDSSEAPIREHINECSDCRAFADHLARGSESAQIYGLDVSPSEVEGRLTRRAVTRFAEESRPRVWQHLLPAFGLTAACATAAAFLLLPVTGVGPAPQPPTGLPLANSVVHAPVLDRNKPILARRSGKEQRDNAVPLGFPGKPERLLTPPLGSPVPFDRPIPEGTGQRVPVRHPVSVATTSKESPYSVPIVDDLTVIHAGNDGFINRWTTLTSDESQRILADVRKSVARTDDFVDVEPPRLVSLHSPEMTRVALAEYRRQLQIVDPRLQRRVTLSLKGASFEDFCRKLAEQTKIEIRSQRNVAEDKITVFCKDSPVRDIMRQVTTLFNFTWDRYDEDDVFTYRLKQSLTSALLEEELRNKDRNEALVALNREMEAFLPLMNLSPEEAKQRVAGMAEGTEKDRMATLAGSGWGPVHVFSLLAPGDLTALRDGQRLTLRGEPDEKIALTPQITHGILQSASGYRIQDTGSGVSMSSDPKAPGVSPLEFGGVRPLVELWLDPSEEGQFRLMGGSGIGVFRANKGGGSISSSTELATGISPSAKNPNNTEANSDLKTAPGMDEKVSFEPDASCRKDFGPITEEERVAFLKDATARGELRVTSADVLEAIHVATGRDVMGDYFTRAYPVSAGTVRDLSRFDALCRVSDSLRMRWREQDDWLGFRSASFFHDRMKEVPNALLERWYNSRKRNRYLTMDDLLQISRLGEVPLKSDLLSEGVKAVYGLHEWTLAQLFRTYLRVLDIAGPSGLQAAYGPNGLTFVGLTPAGQTAFAEAVNAPSSTAESLLTGRLWVSYQLPSRTAKTEKKGEGNAEPTAEPSAEPREPNLKFRYVIGKPQDGLMVVEREPNSMSSRRLKPGEAYNP